MADVFISYAHADKAYADGRGLERVLASARPPLSVWRDGSIAAGSTWNNDIRDELTNARCIVVIWSVTSWASHWVRQEAFFGYMRGILVPMRIDEVKLDAPFNGIQTIDNIGGGNVAGLNALVEGVRRKIAGSKETNP